MSNAFILGVISNETFLQSYELDRIKRKYGTVHDVDDFISNQKQDLRNNMKQLGLDSKHLDLMFVRDDFAYKSEAEMLKSIAQYKGSKAGENYAKTFIEMYDTLKKERPLDLELTFDQALIDVMTPYRTEFVEVDGILAYLFFKLMELKNIQIALKADRYGIEAEKRLRQI